MTAPECRPDAPDGHPAVRAALKPAGIWRLLTPGAGKVELQVDRSGVRLWRPGRQEAWPWQPEESIGNGRVHVAYAWDEIAHLGLEGRGGLWGRSLVLVPVGMETEVKAHRGARGAIVRLARRMPVPAGAEVVYLDHLDVPGDRVMAAIETHSGGRFPDDITSQ